MKKIAVWGMGLVGDRIFALLAQEPEIEVVLAVDSDPNKVGQVIHGKKVEETNTLFSYVKEGKIDSLILAIPTSVVKEVTDQLRGCTDVDVYLLPRHVLQYPEEFQTLAESLVKTDVTKPRLPQFESSLAEHCNIHCKGCLKFCNINTEHEFADFDGVVKDWQRMSELFGSVELVKLLGGEPMLNPDLCHYLKEARRIFPSSDVEIATNGLLINENCKELFQVMKETRSYFHISLYPLMFDKIDAIKELLDREGVWYTVRIVKEFARIQSKNHLYDPVKSYATCMSKQCTFLGKDGYIAVCGKPYYASRYKKLFDFDIFDEEGFWNIYDDHDPWVLIKNLKSPFKACSQCLPAEKFEFFPHTQCTKKDATMEDWYVD